MRGNRVPVRAAWPRRLRDEGGRHSPCSVSFFLVHNQPGQGPRPHRHPYDETLVILDGRVRLSVGDQAIECGPGDFVIGPAGVPHGTPGPARRGW
jgi:quercetin dioxygenase-like cupin family protein